MKKLIMLSIAAMLVLGTVGCGNNSNSNGSNGSENVTATADNSTEVDEATKEAVSSTNDAIKKANELKNYTLTATQDISSNTEDTGTSSSKVVYQYDSKDNKPTANVDLELKSGSEVAVTANLYYSDGYSYASMSGNKVKNKEEYNQFSSETLGTVIPFTLTEDAVKKVEKTENGYKFVLDSTKVQFSDSYMGNGLSLGDITYEVAIDENGVATKQAYKVESTYKSDTNNNNKGTETTTTTTEDNTNTGNVTSASASASADTNKDKSAKTNSNNNVGENKVESTTNTNTDTTKENKDTSDSIVTTISVELAINEIDTTVINEKTDLKDYVETNVETMSQSETETTNSTKTDTEKESKTEVPTATSDN